MVFAGDPLVEQNSRIIDSITRATTRTLKLAINLARESTVTVPHRAYRQIMLFTQKDGET